MVLKAAWTSAAEQVQTTGSVCRCSTSERNWRGGGDPQPRAPLASTAGRAGQGPTEEVSIQSIKKQNRSLTTDW